MANKDNKNNIKEGESPMTLKAKQRRLRRICENTATFGLLLVCAAMISPFATAADPKWMTIFCWVYAAGALIYTVARMVNVSDPDESIRLRRLRRIEFWAGLSFCIASGFWFYTTSRLGQQAGVLALMRNTVLFTIVGAALQTLASWLIVSRMKKEGISDRG